MTLPVDMPTNYKMPKIVIIEWASIIGVFIVCFLFLFSEIKHIETKIDQQAARTDRLYEMYVDSKKDLSDYRKESDQKFYDLLKEKK